MHQHLQSLTHIRIHTHTHPYDSCKKSNANDLEKFHVFRDSTMCNNSCRKTVRLLLNRNSRYLPRLAVVCWRAFLPLHLADDSLKFGEIHFGTNIGKWGNCGACASKAIHFAMIAILTINRMFS